MAGWYDEKLYCVDTTNGYILTTNNGCGDAYYLTADYQLCHNIFSLISKIIHKNSNEKQD